MISPSKSPSKDLHSSMGKTNLTLQQSGLKSPQKTSKLRPLPSSVSISNSMMSQ